MLLFPSPGPLDHYLCLATQQLERQPAVPGTACGAGGVLRLRHLSLFGVPVPDYMDGKPWVIADSAPAPPAEPQRERRVSWRMG